MSALLRGLQVFKIAMIQVPTTKMRHSVRLAAALLGASLGSLSQSVQACPNCKEGLLDNGQNGANLALGFELSIYLMLGAPLLILATLAIVFYWQIKSAKKFGNYPDAASIIKGVESRSLPPASL